MILAAPSRRDDLARNDRMLLVQWLFQTLITASSQSAASRFKPLPRLSVSLADHPGDTGMSGRLWTGRATVPSLATRVGTRVATRGQRRRGSPPRRLTVNWQVDSVDLIALPTSNLEIARWLACATQPPWRRPTPECGSPGSLPVTAGGYLLCGVSAGRAGRQSRPVVKRSQCSFTRCPTWRPSHRRFANPLHGWLTFSRWSDPTKPCRTQCVDCL